MTYIHTGRQIYIQIRDLEEGLGCPNALVVVLNVGHSLPLISIFPRQRHIVWERISSLAKQLSNGDRGSCSVALFTYLQRQRCVNITGPHNLYFGLLHCCYTHVSSDMEAGLGISSKKQQRQLGFHRTHTCAR